MFNKVEPISPVKHKESGWIKPADMTYAANEAVIPIVISEVMMLKDMPIAFSRKSDDGAFDLVAIQALHSGYNVYVDDRGKWLGRYMPLIYRCYPFKMMPIFNSDKTALCVEEGPYFLPKYKEGCIRLFNEDGSMSLDMKKQLNLIKMYDKSIKVTQRLVQQLDDMGLIQPWDLYMQAGSIDTAKKINGLYHIDESLLKSLTAEQHKELVNSGAMALIYGQLFSQHCLEYIALQYRLKNESSGVTISVDESIDELFNEGSTDLFKFD